MTSQKQIEANRRNSLKSTGPITPEGKATVSQNAVTHGLHATKIVLNSPHYKENPEEYNHLLASLYWELKPEGVLQQHLVHKIADALWRYKRAIRAETGYIQYSLDCLDFTDLTRGVDKPDRDSEEGRAEYEALLDHRREMHINRQQIPNGRENQPLLRYEARLDRQLSHSHKLLTILKKIQKTQRREYERNSRKK